MNDLVRMNSGPRYLWSSASIYGWVIEWCRPVQQRVICLSMVVLAVLLMVVYGSVLRWTWGKFVLSGWHWHWALAVIAFALALKSGLPRLSPVSNQTAVALLIVSVIAHVANQLTLDLTLLSALLFILSIHAALGFLIAPERWRTMMWPIVVGVAVLPLDFYLEPFLGYPLRLFSAQMANGLLQQLGVQAMTVQSIVMVDNRASVVDLDCSGINSLWAGGVLYLMLSWLMGLAVGVRWFVLGIFFIALLLAANTLRIVALVLLDINAMHGVASIAHNALSVVGFTAALWVVWRLAERLPKKLAAHNAPTVTELHWVYPVLPLIGFLLISIAILQLYKSKPVDTNSPVGIEHSVALPALLQAKKVALNSAEQQYFGVTGALAEKYLLGSFENDASLVLVTSRWWKAHHVPDYCLQSQGFSIAKKALWKIDSHQTNTLYNVQTLHLTDEQSNPYTAVYWFQSGSMMVADYSARVTDTLHNPDRRWTMVSMLIKGKPDQLNLQSQVKAIHRAIELNDGMTL